MKNVKSCYVNAIVILILLTANYKFYLLYYSDSFLSTLSKQLSCLNMLVKQNRLFIKFPDFLEYNDRFDEYL